MNTSEFVRDAMEQLGAKERAIIAKSERGIGDENNASRRREHWKNNRGDNTRVKTTSASGGLYFQSSTALCGANL